ncbi:DUF2201 family putative metallopeptidase [Sphingomonas sp. 3-13AW]|uniref:DUF2201 family putative metallopeptidase n=1 Tax=Sphingomonas sp. 3-13AW TaxID=3050450 RepID=UPI003BB5D0B3
MGMLKARSRGDASRQRMNIADEANSILMTDPFLMTFLHQLKHYRTLEKDKHIIACTDGEVVEYGPKYESLDLPERTYICLHELGHGIYLHSARAMLWMMRHGYLFPALWNYAADVVINEGIEANPMMRTGLFQAPKLFPPCRMRTTIHDTIAEVVETTGEAPPSDYCPSIYHDLRVEVLYEWLVWALFAMRRYRNQHPMTGQPQGGSACTSQGPESGRAGPKKGHGEEGHGDSRPVPETAVEQMEKDDAWDLREHVEDVRRMIKEGHSSEQIVKAIEDEIEQARGRVQAVVQGIKAAGTGHGSMLMNLSADLPAPAVPWFRIIRDVIDGALGTQLRESYTRPGNVTLCAIAMGNRNLPVSHGTSIYSPRPRILVGLDVSGSMTRELERCCAEIWSMAQMKNAEIDLVTWDDGIQEKITIRDRSDFDLVLQHGLRGGGGTTLMEELFAYAEQQSHQAVVLMTDGYVSVALPEKPRIPVIWAITPGGGTAGLEEYGTIVVMAREPGIALDEAALAMAA